MIPDDECRGIFDIGKMSILDYEKNGGLRVRFCVRLRVRVVSSLKLHARDCV